MNNTTHYCGLDFGTSNSTAGISQNHSCKLVALENNKSAIRSAIFYDFDLQQFFFGQAGVDAYLNGASGRLLMSLKSVLGTSLMHEKTVIFGKLVPYTEILGHLIHHIKQIAETINGSPLTHVVLGRPVRFHDNDAEKDKLAQDTLESIAKQQGFKEIVFQYEPIAAAKTYEQTIIKEQLALIVDIGGGTSDFTVVRLHPKNQLQNRSEDVLANQGIHIGGTDFDKRLNLDIVMPLLGMGTLMQGSSSNITVPTYFYHDLTTWHTLNNLYSEKIIDKIRKIYAVSQQKTLLKRLLNVLSNKQGHHILNSVEIAKQQLSDQTETVLDLTFIEHALMQSISRNEFIQIIQEFIQNLVDKVLYTIQVAGVSPSEISAIFYTGGSTKIPIIRDTINALFSQAEKVQGDAFGSVGLGLTLYAKEMFGDK